MREEFSSLCCSGFDYQVRCGFGGSGDGCGIMGKYEALVVVIVLCCCDGGIVVMLTCIV